MTDYGGMGGVKGGRARNAADLFEQALDRACGERMRARPHALRDGQLVTPSDWYEDFGDAAQVWSALANVDWLHKDGDTASYSFRAAGDLIAAIVGQGEDYMDYYCSAPYATVAEWIAEAMAKEGWHAVPEEITPLLPKEGP